MKIRELVDTGATLVMAGAALVMAGVFLTERQVQATATEGPSFIDDWQAANAEGVWIGDEGAAVVITEFVDFQCPFCQQLAPRIDSILTSGAGDVALVVQHFPLPMHAEAESAARAFECAARQDAAQRMMGALFARQDAFGYRLWTDSASDAAVRDLEAFERCLQMPVDSFPRIGGGRATGLRSGVTGTPTLWVNGRVTPRGQLGHAVDALLNGM